jgi:uncharacterized protein YukJ
MPLKNYGVIKGTVFDYKDTHEKNHFQIVIQTGTSTNDCYRVAVNVRSSEKNSPDLFYFLDSDFKHPVTDKFKGLQTGYTELENTVNTGALDYIRINMFDILQMEKIPTTLPGPDNDLVELVDFWTKKAKTEQAEIYAFGVRWFPKADNDKYFPNIPDQGIHDIHMNQGNPNPGSYAGDNGVWQDGGLFFYFPQSDKWTALFLRFQTQAVHTNDVTGHPLQDNGGDIYIDTNPNLPEIKQPVYIDAALVNPVETDDKGKEKVILFNPNAITIDVTGWGILDGSDRKEILAGVILSGGILTIALSGNTALLGNKGGTITLINKEGIKIDGVAYTQDQANKKGVWVHF